jgi:hypothetical protein
LLLPLPQHKLLWALARSDFKIAGVKRSKFTIPDGPTLACHAKAMKELYHITALIRVVP